VTRSGRGRAAADVLGSCLFERAAVPAQGATALPDHAGGEAGLPGSGRTSPRSSSRSRLLPGADGRDRRPSSRPLHGGGVGAGSSASPVRRRRFFAARRAARASCSGSLTFDRGYAWFAGDRRIFFSALFFPKRDPSGVQPVGARGLPRRHAGKFSESGESAGQADATGTGRRSGAGVASGLGKLIPRLAGVIPANRVVPQSYGQVTSGFQSANMPAGLCFQIQACIR
jgi:hypothetical protein